MLRANRAIGNRNTQQKLMLRAEDEIGYVLGHASNDPVYYKYLALVNLKMGVVKERLEKTNEAIQHFQKAIVYKPNYSSAYIELSKVFKDSGNLEEAKNTILRGLEKAPKSRKLKRRLKEYEKLIKQK